VVIPNWNGQRFLETCLQALRRQTLRDFEVLLVDNASRDESVAYTISRFPEVRVEKLKRNVGFAGAVNTGIRVAGGRYVALLNNDTEADPRWLEELVGTMEAHPELGSAASKMLDFRERTLIDGIGDGLSWYLRPYKIGCLERDRGQYDAPRPVFGACAGAAIYRREAFDTVGLFDEDFFAYLEDVDWSFRAQLAGFPCRTVPSAVVYHIGSATSGRESPFVHYLTHRNRVYLLAKNVPLPLMRRHGTKVARAIAQEFSWNSPEENYRTILRAHAAACLGLGRALRKRRQVQRLRRVSDAYLEAIIDPRHPHEFTRPLPEPSDDTI
jgi:GT2 family glycosyltransferase